MRDKDEPLTPQWLVDNMKIIHFLLSKRGIREDWYPEYEDKVQDIVCAILKDMHKYDKERASKTLYIDLLITKELGKYVKVWKIIERDSDHFSLDTERLGDEFTDAQTVREDITNEIHAEREYNKLTRIQQMEVLGYSFKEIGAVVGLNPDYLRNKKGMSARKGSKQHD